MSEENTAALLTDLRTVVLGMYDVFMSKDALEALERLRKSAEDK